MPTIGYYRQQMYHPLLIFDGDTQQLITAVLRPGTVHASRFGVTSKADTPQAVYDHYVDRGEPEQWIDPLKGTCFADRLSCHRFWPNQFRLLLAAAAYTLLHTLRRWLL